MVTFGFILGEVVRRVTGRTIGQYLRTEIAEPLGIDVHIGLPTVEHGRCAEMVNKPHIRDVLAAGEAPGHPDVADRASDGRRWRWRWGSSPTTSWARTRSTLWRTLEFPATNAHVTALGMATFYNALAQEKLLSPRAHGAGPGVPGRLRHRRRAGRAGGRPRLGPGLHAQSARRRTARTCGSFGHGGSGGSFAFVDLEHRIGYAYVMNYFDATKCNADPRSVALSDEVYSALGVTRD